MLASASRDAPRLLTELLLAQVSAVAPYVAARNVALSLWDVDATGQELPEKFTSARLLDELPSRKAAYPTLELPNCFFGNYSSGVYVIDRNA